MGDCKKGSGSFHFSVQEEDEWRQRTVPLYPATPTEITSLANKTVQYSQGDRPYLR